MGEDDVGFPACNVFADALLAELQSKHYFKRPSYCVGRIKQSVNPYLHLQKIIDTPSVAFSSTLWQDEPVNGGMKGMITKPIFCLPLPFGAEEVHVNSMKIIGDNFRKPVIHMGGPRFPNKMYPRSPLDGLIESLHHILPYHFDICLASNLIFPGPDEGCGILPWNDEGYFKKHAFDNLQQLLIEISKPEILIELRRRFWENLYDIFDEHCKKHLPLRICVDLFKNLDISLAPTQDFKEYYSRIKQDAELFLLLGSLFVKYHKALHQDPLNQAIKELENELKLKLNEFEMTNSLIILINSVLSGEILAWVKKIQT